jgi:glycerophosphoryl diester phosphodiesterase
MSQLQARPGWPYPALLAHRGGGVLAPENTVAGFRTGLAYGYRAAECDVKLSADNVLPAA